MSMTLPNIIRLPTKHCLNFNRIQAITLPKLNTGVFFVDLVKFNCNYLGPIKTVNIANLIY